LHAFWQAPTLAQSPLGSVPFVANAVLQPLPVHILTVQGALTGGQTTVVPPPQTPPVQVVPVVHESPSSHDAPSATPTNVQPDAGTHDTCSHGLPGAGQLTAMPPVQLPPWQVMPVVHASPSEHVVASATLDATQPLAGLHAIVWQGFVDVGHWIITPPPHVPPVQVVPTVHALLSLHVAPSGRPEVTQVPVPGLQSACMHGFKGCGQVTPEQSPPPESGAPASGGD
jgi:hypothetical protein